MFTSSSSIFETLIDKVVLFCIWRTSLFAVFKEQANIREAEPLDPQTGVDRSGQAAIRSKLKSTEKYARCQRVFICILYTFMMLKYLSMILLDSKVFANYRYIDCYLLGRLSFVGRTSSFNKYTAFYFLSTLVVYRSFLYLRRPKFNYQCLDFYLRGRECALLNEAITKSPEMEDESPIGHELFPHDPIEDRMLTSSVYFEEIANEEGNESEHNSIYLIKNHFNMNSILRPNRTLKSWKKIYIFTGAIFVIVSIWTCFFAILIWSLIQPLWVTEAGFQMSYRSCVRWIRAHPDRSDYHHIFEPSLKNSVELDPRKQPFKLPLIDFVPFNPYHMIRICLDLIENVIIYLDILGTYFIHTFIVWTIILDNHSSFKEISRSLKSLIERQHSVKNIAAIEQTIDSLQLNQTWIGNQHKRLEHDLSYNQAILVDHFALISKYNPYVSHHTLHCICMWLLYTGALCAWMAIAGSRAVQLEFHVAEVAIGLWTLALLGAVALARLNNMKLYSLIATAMALDQNWMSTKMRWMIILKYYYPSPLYCYALFKSTPISFLFCVKVSEAN